MLKLFSIINSVVQLEEMFQSKVELGTGTNGESQVEFVWVANEGFSQTH